MTADRETLPPQPTEFKHRGKMFTAPSSSSTLSLPIQHHGGSLDPLDVYDRDSVSEISLSDLEGLTSRDRVRGYHNGVDDWVANTAAAFSAPATIQHRHAELDRAYHSLNERFDTLARVSLSDVNYT